VIKIRKKGRIGEKSFSELRGLPTRVK